MKGEVRAQEQWAVRESMEGKTEKGAAGASWEARKRRCGNMSERSEAHVPHSARITMVWWD